MRPGKSGTPQEVAGVGANRLGLHVRIIRWMAAAVAVIGAIAVVTHGPRPETVTASPRPGAPARRVAVAPTSSTVVTAPPPPATAATESPVPVQRISYSPSPPAAPAPPPPPAPASLPEVSIYGDSLTVMAWAHYADITADELTSYEHAHAGAALPDYRDAIEVDRLARLVLALGTNDAQRDGARPWAEVLNAVPASTCIVWPKPYEGSNAVKLFNTQMTAVIAAHPNVHVVDWDAIAKAHPEWVLPDHIHYTNEGFDRYAEMLEQAATTCP